MWRIEMLHPMVVHFPIALIVTGTLLWFGGLSGSRFAILRPLAPTGSVLIGIAAVASWAAVITGGWADSVVGRSLYDPRVAETHENRATLLAILISVTFGIDLLRHWYRRSRRLATVTVGALLIGCCGLLASTAHLGASLVYQQGAAVEAPSS